MSKQLNSAQRYAIYLGLARKQSKKSIAIEIGVHPSTITREIKRNSNRCGNYVHTVAQDKCNSRKHGMLGNHRKDAILWWRVEQMIIDEDWSPRQIMDSIKQKNAFFYEKICTFQNKVVILQAFFAERAFLHRKRGAK